MNRRCSSPNSSSWRICAADRLGHLVERAWPAWPGRSPLTGIRSVEVAGGEPLGDCARPGAPGGPPAGATSAAIRSSGSASATPPSSRCSLHDVQRCLVRRPAGRSGRPAKVSVLVGPAARRPGPGTLCAVPSNGRVLVRDLPRTPLRPAAQRARRRRACALAQRHASGRLGTMTGSKRAGSRALRVRIGGASRVAERVQGQVELPTAARWDRRRRLDMLRLHASVAALSISATAAFSFDSQQAVGDLLLQDRSRADHHAAWRTTRVSTMTRTQQRPAPERTAPRIGSRRAAAAAVHRAAPLGGLRPRRSDGRRVTADARLVADAADGHDDLGSLRVLLDLGAQPLHVHVDQPGVGGVPVAPDLLQQHLAGEHLARLAGQRDQQVELQRGQRDRRRRRGSPGAPGTSISTSADPQPLGRSPTSARRSRARIRATSSLGLNGLTT